MKQFYEAIKGYVNRDMITKASAVLGEKESNVSTAVSSIIAGFLGVMLRKGNTPQIKNILDEAGNLDILSDVGNICQEKATKQQQNIGDDFLQHLLGDKAADFTNPIADHAGISKVATNRLVSMMAPVFAGYLGNIVVREKWSMSRLMDEIEEQKNSFRGDIPAGVVSAFSLSPVLHGNATTTTTHRTTNKDVKKEENKKNNSWIIWLVIIILLLLIFFLWRSCRNNNTQTYVSETVTVTATEPQTTTVTTTERTMTELTLPNGVKLQAYRGGIEDEMIRFLQSNEYRNATDEQLKDRWFQFDNIRFEFGSATDLMSGSQTQINNIIEILKYYKDAKIKVGGFADKVGTEQANMQISRERAKTIESLLDNGGVGRQVVRIEGFGDEYAKHSASDSDRARSEDRDVALRFVK